MKIIPVIDIQNGQAVLARGGERATYQPLKTRFADSAEPREVIAGLLGASLFDSIYIADLDALTGAGDNRATLLAAAAAWPRCRFVVDIGLRPATAVTDLLAADNIDLIIASEALGSMVDYHELRRRIPPQRCLLSLDRRAGALLGPALLFGASRLWPTRIIHMDLARVGANQGPDLEGLEALATLAPLHQIHAAGGVRNAADLEQLAGAGVHAVLVGSALHDGRLEPKGFVPDPSPQQLPPKN